MFSKLHPIIAKHLIYFCKKRFCQGLSKVAQFGHTVPNDFHKIVTVQIFQFCINVNFHTTEISSKQMS